MNTDDYEGHTPGPWKLTEGDQYDDDWPWLDIVAENGYEIQECVGFSDAKPGPDVRLMVDAPLLLAEVKRLRKNESELLSAISQVRERVYKELIQKMKELIE
tara:strand:+ start:297 stop:602 length:306 start_codon:yes stop_codon:yes gene_type:complete